MLLQVPEAHRNQVIHLHQQSKSAASMTKFRQGDDHCEKVLELAKLTYTYKITLGFRQICCRSVRPICLP